MFALVDCNSCFASCEQIFRPDLRGKPVVVLSNNDGCIVARSAEAKALNIPDLEPYFKQKPLLDKYGVAVFSSNYELYGDISNRVMNVLQEYGEIEIYSIDEAFLDFSELEHFNLKHYGVEIKQQVWKDVRMPVSVGIAPTKTLAKLANHIAKRAPGLPGVCVLEKPETIRKALSLIKTDKLWGVGRKLSLRLELLGIRTALDLANANPKEIRRQFSVNLERTIRELNGEVCFTMEQQPPAKKQIFCSRMFGYKMTDIRELEQAVSQYASRACVKLRKQNSLVKSIVVQLMTSRFASKRYYNSIVIGLESPTEDSREVIRAARQGVRAIYRSGYQYAKAAVGLIELVDKVNFQYDFFQRLPRKNTAELMQLIDHFNRQSQGQLFLASDGINTTWQMTRRLKSPAYTTRWAEIPRIKI